MSVELKFTLDRSALNKLTSSGGMVDRASARAAGKVRDTAKGIIRAEGRIDTGAMLQGVRSEKVSTSPQGVTYKVVADQPYSKFQHDGTRGPIYPRRAKVLRFTVGGKTVFAPKVRGVTGIFFLTRALQQVRTSDWG